MISPRNLSPVHPSGRGQSAAPHPRMTRSGSVRLAAKRNTRPSASVKGLAAGPAYPRTDRRTSQRVDLKAAIAHNPGSATPTVSVESPGPAGGSASAGSICCRLGLLRLYLGLTWRAILPHRGFGKSQWGGASAPAAPVAALPYYLQIVAQTFGRLGGRLACGRQAPRRRRDSCRPWGDHSYPTGSTASGSIRSPRSR